MGLANWLKLRGCVLNIIESNNLMEVSDSKLKTGRKITKNTQFTHNALSSCD